MSLRALTYLAYYCTSELHCVIRGLDGNVFTVQASGSQSSPLAIYIYNDDRTAGWTDMDGREESYLVNITFSVSGILLLHWSKTVILSEFIN